VTSGLIQIFREFGEEDKYKEIRDILLEHKKRFITELRPTIERPKRLIGQNALNYIQMALIRSNSLIEGSLEGLKSKNILISMLCTRAHYEGTGGVAYLLKKLENFYEGQTDEGEIEHLLFRLVMGTKDSIVKKKYKEKYREKYNTPETIDPINVLNMIDAADTYANKMNVEKIKMYRKSYEFLSEFCHPNDFAFQLTKKIKKKGIVRYYTEPILLKQNFLTFCNYLLISAPSFIYFYDKVYELLEENEDLPIRVKLN